MIDSSSCVAFGPAPSRPTCRRPLRPSGAFSGATRTKSANASQAPIERRSTWVVRIVTCDGQGMNWRAMAIWTSSSAAEPDAAGRPTCIGFGCRSLFRKLPHMDHEQQGIADAGVRGSRTPVSTQHTMNIARAAACNGGGRRRKQERLLDPCFSCLPFLHLDVWLPIAVEHGERRRRRTGDARRLPTHASEFS